MPQLPHVCTMPGCPVLVYGQSRCAEHQKAHEERWGEQRKVGYGREWRKRRTEYIEAHPFCADPFHTGCTAFATDVDHILSRTRGGSEDESNLQSLCGACHRRKTVLVDGGFGNKHSA